MHGPPNVTHSVYFCLRVMLSICESLLSVLRKSACLDIELTIMQVGSEALGRHGIQSPEGGCSEWEQQPDLLSLQQ